jgi:uncharacterized protein (TIGR03435 family)
MSSSKEIGMRALGGGLFLVITGCLFGQATGARLEFDVVDIKPNNSGDANGSGGILPSGQFRAVNIPLKEIIKFAFHVRDEAIVGAPAWTESEHYDIVGKAAPVGSEETFYRSTRAVALMRLGYSWDDTFRQMVQSMLADQFKLKFHKEQKTMSVFALEIAKGGDKLQKSAEAGQPQCSRTVGAGLQAEATCKNVSMDDLGQGLQVLAEQYVDRDVVDLTGLPGSYDLKLSWVGRTTIDQVGGLTMPAALEKQLGLKLERRNLPVPVIVIDHIEKATEN